jgi:hypothetical protein
MPYDSMLGEFHIFQETQGILLHVAVTLQRAYLGSQCISTLTINKKSRSARSSRKSAVYHREDRSDSPGPNPDPRAAQGKAHGFEREKA